MSQFKRTINRPRLHNYVVDASESNIGNLPLAGAEREFSGSVRPNGSGSFGFVRRKGELARERTRSRDRKMKILGVQYLDWDKYPGEANTTRVVRCSLGTNSKTPLTLSEPLIGRSGQKRCAKGLTRRGIRTVESGIALLEKKYGIRNLGFYTLTCPFTEVAQIDAFNEAFPDIVRRTLEKMKRHYEKKGQTFSYVGVHEIQTARRSRYGTSCLHFHFVAPCRALRRRGFLCSADQIRDWYEGAIKTHESLGDAPSPRVGAEVCRTSASAYLAKYYCKGVPENAEAVERTRTVVLSSWYSVSRNLHRAIKICTYQLDADMARSVIRHNSGERTDDRITFSRAIKVCRDGRDMCVGYVFTMSASFMSAWLSLCMLEVCSMI